MHYRSTNKTVNGRPRACAHYQSGNMGTLIRSAAAMAKKAVVIVEGTDIWNPKVVQATAGALALVDIYELNGKSCLLKKAMSRSAHSS